MKSKSLARVHHEGKVRRRTRRHHKLERKARSNPKHNLLLIGGGVVAVGLLGYFGWRYMAQHPKLAAGGSYSIPAGSVVLTLPAGGTWVGLVQTAPAVLNSSLTLATPGSTAPLNLTAVKGITYLASWTASDNSAQTATITVT